MGTLVLVKAQKGQVLDLSKSAPGTSMFRVGLGWNVNQDSSIKDDFDIDVVAIKSDLSSKGALDKNVFFYNNVDGNGSTSDAAYSGLVTKEDIFKKAEMIASGSVVTISKDNRTGEGDGDDETLFVNTNLLSDGDKITIAVNIYEAMARRQNFGMVKGAYLFRGIALLISSFLIKIIWLKIVGGGFLLYLTIKHFVTEEGDSSAQTKNIKWLGLFWSTVLYVEIADITFSIDNVFAAVALSSEFWVVFTGVAFGILAMRFVAQWFIRMIEIYPSLNTSAFIVIGMLGVKLLINGILDYVPSLYQVRDVIESHNADMAISALTLIIFFFPLLFTKKAI